MTEKKKKTKAPRISCSHCNKQIDAMPVWYKGKPYHAQCFVDNKLNPAAKPKS